jgi:hypothetical protein
VSFQLSRSVLKTSRSWRHGWLSLTLYIAILHYQPLAKIGASVSQSKNLEITFQSKFATGNLLSCGRIPIFRLMLQKLQELQGLYIIKDL